MYFCGTVVARIAACPSPLSLISSWQAPAKPHNCRAQRFPYSRLPAQYQVASTRLVHTPIQASSASQGEATDRLSVQELKAALLDSFWGVERGLNASSDARAEINELISQLEANNPTPMPNDAQDLLNGSWRLVYTANSELLALLALSRLPLVTVEEISQVVDGVNMTVENKIQLSGPLVRTSFATSASVEVRSPKLLQVKFREGRVATPELLQDVALPQSLEVLGQRVDLSPVQGALQPLEGPVRGVLSQLGGLLAQQPDLQFPIQPAQASTWLLNTFLDSDLRITRGDGGSVYVLVKDSSTFDSEQWLSTEAALYAPSITSSDSNPPAVPPPSPAVAVVAATEIVEDSAGNLPLKDEIEDKSVPQ